MKEGEGESEREGASGQLAAGGGFWMVIDGYRNRVSVE
jgi:hypothetical protein